MNCQNCGGPIHETSGRGRMVCSFCGSLQQAPSDENSIDRIVFLDQFGDYGCPCCGVQLSKALIDDVIVEACKECDGIFLDREAFHDISWNRRAAYDGAEEAPIPVSQEELQEERDCPKCHNTMETHPYYGPGNSVIDSCNRCHIVWLDAGELTTIERAPGLRKLRR